MPDWAVGKTADEILKTAEMLYQSVLSGESPSQPDQGPQAPVQPTSQPYTQTQTAPQAPTQPNVNANSQQYGANAPTPPDPDLIYTNKAEYQRQLDAYIRHQNQTSVQAASAPILKPLARMARSQSQSDPKFKAVWQKYGPEIDLAIKQNVPEQNRTDPDIWNQAAKLVAGEHWEELAQSRAESVAAQPPDSGTVSGGGVTNAPTNGGRASVDPLSKLFREDHPSVRKFKRLGKNADDLKAHAARMGHSAEEYAEMLKARAQVSWSAKGEPQTEEEARHAAALSHT